MSRRKENLKLLGLTIVLTLLFHIVFFLVFNALRIRRVKKRLISVERKHLGSGTSTWISDLPEEVKNKPITKLKLVGTHDSQSYQLINHPLAGAAAGPVKWSHANIIQNYWGIGKEFLSDWTLTQNKDIFTQLASGVRAFDLRSTYSPKGVYIYSHSIACDTVESVLSQVKEFISVAGPNELIFLWSKPDWPHRENFKDQVAKNYVELVKKHLGQLLIPRHSGDLKTIKEYIDSGKRVFFLMDPDTADPLIWPYSTIKSQWNPTIDRDELYQYNLNIVKNSQPLSDQMISVGLSMSPLKETIIKEGIMRLIPLRKNKSIKNFSQPIQDQYYRLLKDTGEKMNNINIWWTDFPTDNFIKTIIKSNI